MKTTIEISDALLKEARQVASAEHRTLRDLVEEGLRVALERRKRRERFKLPDRSVSGKGLSPAFAQATWEEILDASYRGRGT